MHINREQLSQSARDALKTFTNETGLIVHHVVARNEQWQMVMVDVDPETPAERRYREREAAGAKHLPRNGSQRQAKKLRA